MPDSPRHNQCAHWLRWEPSGIISLPHQGIRCINKNLFTNRWPWPLFTPQLQQTGHPVCSPPLRAVFNGFSSNYETLRNNSSARGKQTFAERTSRAFLTAVGAAAPVMAVFAYPPEFLIGERHYIRGRHGVAPVIPAFQKPWRYGRQIVETRPDPLSGAVRTAGA